jgi:hypothetical protein
LNALKRELFSRVGAELDEETPALACEHDVLEGRQAWIGRVKARQVPRENHKPSTEANVLELLKTLHRVGSRDSLPDSTFDGIPQLTASRHRGSHECAFGPGVDSPSEFCSASSENAELFELSKMA